jgi:hypothetical protein
MGKRTYVWLHTFLISALGSGKWSAEHSNLFTPWDETRSTHWAGSWMGLTAGVDMMAKGKISIHIWNQMPCVGPQAHK